MGGFEKSLGFHLVSTSTEFGEYDEEYEEPTANIVVSTTNGVVGSIEARKTCIYRGVNLIGIDIDELERALGCKASSIDPPVQYDNGDIQTFRNYESLDLFVTEENGVVVSLTCYGDAEKDSKF